MKEGRNGTIISVWQYPHPLRSSYSNQVPWREPLRDFARALSKRRPAAFAPLGLDSGIQAGLEGRTDALFRPTMLLEGGGSMKSS
jgi:hypothetical protein